MQFSQIINTCFNVADNCYQSINSFFWGLIIKTGARARGIKIGNQCNFYGYSKFKKANAAQIIIGSNNNFRSFATSNLIGINRPCIISALEKSAIIKIGDRNGFSGTVIGCFKAIEIGNNVKCGANTLITDGDWHSEDKRSGKPAKITIEDNVWLGVNVTVLKGVTIGQNSLIGANSLVVKSIPPNSIAVGNPCVVVRKIL